LNVAVRNLASALAGVFALGAFPRALFQLHRRPGPAAAAPAAPIAIDRRIRNPNQEENE
jgi:hypothetical protein